mgnify:CR=1 FL=1
MAKFELKLPKMGESVAEATITNWLKEVGETPLMDLLVENDYVRFGNEHIKGRCTPCTHGINEVMVVKPTWKNSK